MQPLRIALLASYRLDGMDRLLADPNRGSTWELTIVVGAGTALQGLDLLEAARVPVELRPIRQQAAFRNLRAREAYDAQLAELFLALQVDYILLPAHQYILTEALLEPFAGRILALHDADLSIRDAHLYAGPHAVRDAILAGEPETRSSVYVVTPEVARGPLFLLGAPHPVADMALDARDRGDAAFLTAYAELHRRWMTSSWGDLFSRTLELLAAGTTQTVGDVVWIDGAPGPCRMGEAPRACHEMSRGIPASCPFIG